MSPDVPYIIVGGEQVPVPGALKIVHFADPIVGEQWSFYRDAMDRESGGVRQLWSKRQKGSGGASVETVEDLKQMLHQIVLHSDCTATSAGCYRVLVDRALSTHFMLDWDGTLYQGADILHRTYHAADANNASIGIDLNNHMRYDADKTPLPYTAYSASAIVGSLSGEWKKQERQLSEPFRIHNSTMVWYGYTDEQYTSLQALLRVLKDMFPLLRNNEDNGVPQPPMDETGQVIGTVTPDGIAWRGIIAHWHISTMKWDPGPGFDWQRIYHGMRGEDNFFPVQLSEQEGPRYNAQVMEEEAGHFFANTDKGSGGFYPIGINETWHGGIHLHASEGAAVRAMLTGQVVAARFAPQTPLGSTSFLVLRHVIDMPRANEKPGEFTKLTVFSLYMHLADVDFEADPSVWPKWVQAAFRQSLQNPESESEIGRAKAARKLEAERAAAQGAPPRKPYSRVGQGFAALVAGDIALFEYKGEAEIVVSSGVEIGNVGLFGARRALEPLVHIEVFADESWRKAIDLAIHSAHWFAIEDPQPGKLRVESRSILQLMGASEAVRLGRRDFLFPDRILTPSKVRAFYGSDGERSARDYLRRAIVRHTSEWSDRVDWIRAMTEAQDWGGKQTELSKVLADDTGAFRHGVFSRDILDILPFTWLTQEVADHMKLAYTGSWEGMVYHFHPIQFLVWLSFYSSSRIRVVARGMTRKELEKQAARDRERLEANRQAIDLGAFIDPNVAEEFVEESTNLDLAIEFPNPTGPLDTLRDIGRSGGTTLWQERPRGTL